MPRLRFVWYSVPLLPLIAAGLFALALVLYWATIMASGFDGLIGQDPFGYYGYALQVPDSIAAFRAPPPNYWPLGYPLLMAAGFVLLGPTPLVGQLVSTLTAAGTVALTCVLAHDLLRQHGSPAQVARRVGLVAGLLTLGCGQLWQWGIVIMADAPALCLGTLAAWALVRYASARRLRWLALASVALGGAIITRWLYGLLALPLGAYWILAVALPALPAHRKEAAWHLFIAALPAAVLLLPQLLLSARFEQSLVAQQWLVGWSPLNAARRQFVTRDGVANYALPVGLFYARAAISPRFLFPLFAPLLVLGAAGVLQRRWWPAAALIGGWIVAILGFLGGIPYQNFRYVLALLPPLAIIAASGFEVAWGWVQPRWRIALVAYLCAGLLAGLWYSGGVVQQYVAGKQASLAIVDWVEQQTQPADRLLAFELTLTLRHYTTLDVRELFDQTPASLATLVADDQPLFLLVDTNDIKGQWQGHAPERNVSWLRDHAGLAALGELNGYTLFRVGRSGKAVKR
ncbi:MAG: glycosyltransferase family 39 protein [Chloroflexales bacterium]|nr:glycosyltransferase family 39 protein [Chloroflexales bacterium]